ncbi:MAG TPA: hypothetical protein DD433_04240 [Ruminococcaceae bacterium]|jgi:hypothetical protein|nr:hypothetical protein [Oscillospiraceae bacterium]
MKYFPAKCFSAEKWKKQKTKIRVRARNPEIYGENVQIFLLLSPPPPFPYIIALETAETGLDFMVATL